MKHLDLCSGIGGFALAARWAGVETVAFCEIEEYPRRVLAKNFPGVPIHHDIHDLNGTIYESVDLVTAGYPCQPFSSAGRRGGASDDRHLWPEVLRVVTEARPAWALFENVFNHVHMGLDSVLSDLETENYATRAFIIPACAVDAPHRRDRVWIVAHANDARQCASSGHGRNPGDKKRDDSRRRCETVADASSARLERRERSEQCGHRSGSTLRNGRERPQWAPEPRLGRLAHGVPRRMDRIRGLGNAVVPQLAYRFIQLIREQFEEENGKHF